MSPLRRPRRPAAKAVAALLFGFAAIAPAFADEGLKSAAPALERFTQGSLLDGVWKRPGLSARDRSIVTLAAIIARGDASELTFHVNFALTNGVKPGEISEIVNHLAFYAGWGRATTAAPAVAEVFRLRGVPETGLPGADPQLSALNEAAEADRVARVKDLVGPVSPSLEQDTTDFLFRSLWLRPGLAPRDRGLVTVSTLIATGQVAQLASHLNRAMDAGLTKPEAGEALSHIAFYAGWPAAFSAVPVFKSVFEARAK